MEKQRKTILIVDDDEDFVDSISSFLREHGFRVSTARNGTEGIKRARMLLPDLIIMDIMMDERTEGIFAVQELRRTPQLESVPVFVLSALYGKVPDFKIGPSPEWLAHDRFLSKPVHLPDLLEAICGQLGSENPAEPAAEQ